MGTSSSDICSICMEEFDENDEGRCWIQCDVCYQWVHCDCAEVGDSIVEDEYDAEFRCDKCTVK